MCPLLPETMKNLILPSVIFILSIQLSFATAQGSELIIYNGDTLELLSAPLEDYLGAYEDRIEKYPILNEYCSTALGRGYQGLWKLVDDELYLIDVCLCAEEDKSIMHDLFKAEEPVKATWFTGKLFIQHGKMIRYRHSGFERVYEEETVIEIGSGEILGEEHFINGTRSDDHGFSSIPDSVVAEVYRRINWDNLPELSKDKRLFIRLKIGGIDSLTIIHSNTPEVYTNETQRVLGDFPQMKKFFSRGKPVEEVYKFSIAFSNEERRKYAR